jgi:uncharacterized protein (TIGR03435 family)
MASVKEVNQTDRMDAADAMMVALEQQMGLRLESRKDSVDALVIDQMEKTPTAN